MNVRIRISLRALIAVQALALAAHAEPEKTEKKDSSATLVKAGDEKAASGDCDAALKSYRAAEAAKPSPEAEWGLASCEDKLGRAHPAVEAYEKFLAHGTEVLGPKLAAHADEARARIEALRKTPAAVHVETTPPDATLSVDDAPAASTHDLQLAPGPHVIHVTAPNYESTRVDLDVFFGMKRQVSVALRALPPPPPPPPPPAPPPPPEPIVVPPARPLPAEEPGLSRQTVAWIAGGGAIVGFALGAAFGGIALHHKNEFDKSPTTMEADRASDFAVYTDIALGAGVLLGLTSAVLFLSGHEQAAAAVNSHVSSGKSGTSVLLHF